MWRLDVNAALEVLRSVISKCTSNNELQKKIKNLLKKC